MKVLVACEESQEVCKAFRALGHEAYSCDIEPCSGGHPEWHLQVDALELLKMRWDMILAFPPCTDLAVSGAKWFAEKQADGRQKRSIDFFLRFANADCPKISIENPVGIMSTVWRKPDQIIQPWMFGHGETKKTCLWLKGLPHLIPTHIVDGREQRVWRMPPSADRAKLRSRTYHGVAKAMAEQWGGICPPEGEEDTRMKCRNCKYLRWAEEYPGMPFFGWCDNVNDSPDMDMERECGRFESATHADIIRRTSDEELAEFLSDFKDCAGDCLVGRGVKDCSGICATRETLKMWLQQPAQEDA